MATRGVRTKAGIGIVIVLFAALFATVGFSRAALLCDPAHAGCMPTPSECRSGQYNGVWPGKGGSATTLTVCVAQGGHILLYVGGDVGALCGVVIVNDEPVAGDANTDPNTCIPPGIPPGSTWSEQYFRSGDGTMLHADVFRPANIPASAKTPVVLIVSPYFGTGGGPPFLTPTGPAPFILYYYVPMMIEAIARGYTVVDVTLRGEGGSGGCGDLGGPGEQADAKASVEWAASQPWSTGHVGMWGLSYDAWAEVMALAENPAGLDAAVIQAPIIDFYRAVYMNRNRFGTISLFPAVFLLGDLTPQSIRSNPSTQIPGILGTVENPGCYTANQIDTLNPNPATKYWRDRNLVPRASASTVPVLWSHGLDDLPMSFLDVWSKLKGPKRAWFGQYGHGLADSAEAGDPLCVGRSGFLAEAFRWLDHYVAGTAPLPDDPPVEVQQDYGPWRAESTWPPADVNRSSIPLKPGSYRDILGNTADGRTASLDPTPLMLVPSLVSSPGNGSWTFTQALPYDVHFAGMPRISVSVEAMVPNVNLVALLYDVDAHGSATIVSRGAYVVPRSGTVAFDMYPQDWRIKAGHRIGVLLSGSDDSTFTPGLTGTMVTITSGSLSLPFLTFDRASFLSNAPTTAINARVPFKIKPATIGANSVSAPLPPPLS